MSRGRIAKLPFAPLTASLLVATLACTSGPGNAPEGGSADGRDDDFGAVGKGDGSGDLSAAEIAGVLEVVNELSVTELDDDVGLDHRAANGIVARRDTDGEFEALDELDAVAWVGANALAKLVEYAIANGYVEGASEGEACLLISEYAEGTGNNNKAVEVWNCGDETITLGRRSLCLVRNGDQSCTVTDAFDDVQLAAGDTWVVCRNAGGTWNDPLQSLRDRCDQEMPGVVLMSGDDRFAVLDQDGSVLDAFGRLTWRPSTEIWANMVLRRCDLEPYLGTGFFTTEGRYTQHSGNTQSHLGVAPTDGCE